MRTGMFGFEDNLFGDGRNGVTLDDYKGDIQELQGY